MCPQLLQMNWTISTVAFPGCALPNSSITGTETISSPPSHPCIEHYGQSGTTLFSLKNRFAFCMCSALSGMLLAPFLGTLLQSSGIHITCDPTRLHGSAESCMVPLGLVGVGLREVDDGPVEALALAQVGCDLHAVAGAGMRTGKRPAAEARIKDQLFGRHALYLRRALHVSQLTPVVVAARFATKPAEEDVAGGLHQALAGHHAVSPVVVDALREV